MPAKKKAFNTGCLALKLAEAVLRGTNDLWPDERVDSKFEDTFIPNSSPIVGDEMGREIFEFFSEPMLTALKDLASQEEHPVASKAATSASAEAVLDPMEVPKMMKKLIKMIAELIGPLRQCHAGDSRLFPSSTRGHSRHSESLHVGHGIHFSLTSPGLPKLHHDSDLRELPRMWWTMRVADHLEMRREERVGGHCFAGRRKDFMEAICGIAMHASFQEVKVRAQQVISILCKFHIGSRWALTKRIILPALGSEAESALRCGALTGEEAVREQQRLNNSLSGIASILDHGRGTNLIPQAWRRGIDDASAIALGLCEAIYSVTKITALDATAPAPSKDEKKCEVEAETTTRLIAATKHWLDAREVHCELRSAQDKAGVDDRPAGELEELEPPKQKRRGLAALEVVEKLLGICEQSDCFWRAQVMCTSVMMALLNSLHGWSAEQVQNASLAAEEVQTIVSTWKHWVQWLLRCCDSKAPPLLNHLGVYGLMLILKRPAPLTKDHLQEAGLNELNFLEKLLAVMPPLRHDQIVHHGDRGGVQLEPTKQAVDAMVDQSFFKLWPRVWTKRSSKTFSTWNALFWQSYFVFLHRSSPPDRVVAIITRAAEHLCSQPVAEAEYHATLAELAAGALRALRKDTTEAASLRRRAWSALHPHLLVELQKGSQERLDDWCDAVRFAACGTSKPLLRHKLFEPVPAGSTSQDSFLTPLFNFVLNIEACPADEALTCAMSPIRYEGDDLKDCVIVESSEVYSPPSRADTHEGSSFEVYKRLRLLMALLVEPSAMRWISLNEAFCNGILEALRPGIGHPYKQLREETARAIYLILRAARAGGPDTCLGKAARQTEAWLGDEAQRLLLRLRADNAAAKKGQEAESRPAHVLESSGLCYVLLHTGLARMSATLLAQAVPRSIEFLLAATAHDDFELRGLASLSLQICCSAHATGPEATADIRWCQLPHASAVSSLLTASIEQSALPEKELEKALSIAVRPALLGNLYILSCCDDSKALLTSLRSFSRTAMSHRKAEVRQAAKGVFTSILTLDAEADLLACVKELKEMAGPIPKPGQEPPASNNQVVMGVFGLSCALLAAADRGIPAWTGQVVQKIAPYSRKGMSETVTKEVQAALQGFLKLMQSGHHTWKQCQEKLTEKQLDLLDANKGQLSYFS
jgi:hypothetical protein